MKTFKHNPHCRLVSITKDNKEIVYGINNDGSNAGLEIYRFRDGEIGHYHSSRYVYEKLPVKYIKDWVYLKGFISTVEDGYKLEL